MPGPTSAEEEQHPCTASPAPRACSDVAVCLGNCSWGWPDLVGLTLLALAGVFLVGAIDREIDYDEANYLSIAKSIARTGLPYLRGLENIGREEVFITSPPLVMAVAAVSQAHWPGQLWPSRLVQVLVFSWPLYVLVWWISRRLYGPWPACFALAVLLSHAQFLGHASVVRLDVPLGLWSLASLWCFYRALEPGRKGLLWAVGAGLTLAAAVATKFQAVCIPAGIGLFLAALVFQQQWQTLLRALRPMGVQLIFGLLVLGGLYSYLIVLPGPEAPQYGGGLTHTTQQLDASGLTSRQILAYYLALPVKAMIYLGWPLWIALLGLLPGRAEGRFAALLASYAAAVVLFNVAVAKLCGAGTYYLISLMPALAVLGGRGAAIALEEPPTRGRFVLGGLLLGLLAWQWLADRPWQVPFRIPAGSSIAQVAQFLDQIDPAGDGVLAEDTGVQFFSDRPTTVLQFAPYEAVQIYLEGRGPYPVSFVVLRAASLAKPDPFLAKHWPTTQKLLKTHFDRLRSPTPNMVIFVRKGKQLR